MSPGERLACSVGLQLWSDIRLHPPQNPSVHEAREHDHFGGGSRNALPIEFADISTPNHQQTGTRWGDVSESVTPQWTDVNNLRPATSKVEVREIVQNEGLQRRGGQTWTTVRSVHAASNTERDQFFGPSDAVILTPRDCQEPEPLRSSNRIGT